RSRSQHPPVRRDVQRGDPAVLLRFGLPQFLARAEVDALDAVASVQIVRPRQIQTPVVGGKPGGSHMRIGVIAAAGRMAAFDLGGGYIYHPDGVLTFGV